jgi:microcystin-dependent protein
MSTLKVNEVRHLSNTGSANIVLESNSNTNLQTTGTKALSVDGTLTVTGLSTLNGDTVVGNATTDSLSLISTVSGYNNFSGFTGEIRMYAGNAAGNAPPAGWLYCNGNSIALDSTTSNESWEGSSSAATHQGSTYQALFNLLKESNDWGNAVGAVWGTNKIKLPDFRSRSPVGVGTGAAYTITNGTDSVALTVRALGDTTGAQNHVLVTAEIPAHLHGATSAATTSGYDTVATVFAGALTGTIPAHSHTVVDHVHTTGSHTHGVPAGTSGSTTPGVTGNQSASHTHTGAAHTHALQSYVSSWSGGGSYAATGTHIGNLQSQQYSGSTTPGAGGTQSASHTHTSAAHTHTTPASTTNSQSSSNTGSSGAQTSSEQALASVTFNDSTPTLTSTVTPGGHTHTIATTNTGGGGSHNNISPLIAVNFIIKV